MEAPHGVSAHSLNPSHKYPVMKIILLAGHAGSGKDTVGSFFVEQGYKRYAFADKVKIHTASLHGFPHELTLTQEGKATRVQSKTSSLVAPVRWFLIEESRHMKEVMNDEAFWARSVANDIGRQTHDCILTDWRYKAEYKHLQEQFPNAQLIPVRVLRNVIPSEDPSEHELDHVHYDQVIRNYGSLEELHAEIRAKFRF